MDSLQGATEENVFLLATSNSLHILGEGVVLMSTLHHYSAAYIARVLYRFQTVRQRGQREPLLKSQESVYHVMLR